MNMKSQKNFKAIGMIVTLLVLLFSTVSSNYASAQRSAMNVVEDKPELQVKFIGSNGEYLFFEVELAQANQTRSNLRIKNENGNELYSETVFQKNAVRKLKIAKDEAEKIEFAYSTNRGEVKKLVEIKIKTQEAIEVRDITKL
jgi:hypothetical protein